MPTLLFVLSAVTDAWLEEGEVFLIGCLAVVAVWLYVVWRRQRLHGERQDVILAEVRAIVERQDREIERLEYERRRLSGFMDNVYRRLGEP